tara:strand:- start:1324 stop:2766 length:1443 start_codon:yes stop_codon:yes gene_type:complete
VNILISGATGYVGSRLVVGLSGEHQVKSLVRNKVSYKSKFGHLNTTICQGDLSDLESIEGHFENVDVAFYLVHSLSAGNKFYDIELKCAQNFVIAAQKHKVKKIVYLGGLSDNSKPLSPHLKSRNEVGVILRESGISCIEFQSSIIIGEDGLSYEIMKSLVNKLPIMITPRWVSSLAQPIWINDVIRYLKKSISIPVSGGLIVQIGGPDVVTYRNLMAAYADIYGLKRFMIPVPVLTPRLSSLWLGLVTPAYARAGKKLIESLKTDSVINDKKGMELFGITPVSYKQALKNVIDVKESDIRGSRWFDPISSGPRLNDNKSSKEIVYKYQMIDQRRAITSSDKIQAFKPINDIGGPNGWYFANFLWKIRGWIDLFVGGVGTRRTRFTKDKFVIGDTLDWWRISDVIDGEMVEFKAEMRLPGEAYLKFSVTPSETGTEITQTAEFRTNNILGILYWYSLYPLHAFIFSRMIKAIKKRTLVSR